MIGFAPWVKKTVRKMFAGNARVPSKMKRSVTLGVETLETRCTPFTLPLTKITFDEVTPGTPINNLTIKGVTFHDTQGAFVYPPINFPAKFVQFPVALGGPAGETLTMNFAHPTNHLQFDVGLYYVPGPVTAGFTVQLFGPQHQALGTFNVNTQNYIYVTSEGEFNYSGQAVSQAVVTFNSGAGYLFFLDNIVYSPTLAGGRYH